MAVFAKKTTVVVDTHVHVKRGIVVTIVSTVSSSKNIQTQNQLQILALTILNKNPIEYII